MATFYLRATGNWNGATTWSDTSGGAANGLTPDATTDCIANAASGAANLTINGTSGTPSLCRSLVCTGFTGTLTQGAAAQLNIGDGTAGAFTLSAGVTYVPNGVSVLKFVSTTTGNNITCAGKTFGLVTFDGVGGGWVLQDAYAPTGTTLTNGTLNTNGQTVSGPLESDNANTRVLTLGATTWTLGTTGVQWNILTPTGMTLSAASATITLPSTTQTPTINGGGLTYGTFTATALTTGTTTITGANTFTTLTLSMGTGTKSITSGYALRANQTVTGTFTAAGTSAILRNFIRSDTAGTQRTITAATVTVTHTDFRDITGAGAGSWDFSALTTNANGNAGNNSGITFTTPKNCYHVVNAASNWSASNWKTTSGGSTNITPAVPLIHDTAIIDANASYTVSRTLTNSDQPRIPSVNWTGAPNTPAWATGSTAWEACGFITLISGMTHTGGGNCTLAGRGTFAIDGGTLTWPASSELICNCGTGTYSFSQAFTSSDDVTVTSGTLSVTFTITYDQLLVNGGTLALAALMTGSGNITLSGGSITDAGASGELAGTSMTVSGGTHELHEFNLSSTFAISSTAALTLNPGVSTWVTSFTETGTTHSLTYNGTATNINGTLTVTAAGAAYAGSGGLHQIDSGFIRA